MPRTTPSVAAGHDDVAGDGDGVGGIVVLGVIAADLHVGRGVEHIAVRDDLARDRRRAGPPLAGLRGGAAREQMAVSLSVVMRAVALGRDHVADVRRRVPSFRRNRLVVGGDLDRRVAAADLGEPQGAQARTQQRRRQRARLV